MPKLIPLFSWQPFIYTVNPSPLSPPSLLRTPLNKGHESLAYLTFILDNYDALPATIAFMHAHERGRLPAWHVDAPGHSNPYTLQHLSLPLVQRAGYVNLRCNWNPGCSLASRRYANKNQVRITPSIWSALFGNETAMPEVIAQACCAQFVVSRERVRARKREDYVRMRDWVVGTGMGDDESGRVMEYLWHVVFGEESIFCPDRERCYCEVYGRCGGCGWAGWRCWSSAWVGSLVV